MNTVDLAKLIGFPVRPLDDTVFIRRVDVLKSAIIITPDNAKGSPVEGMVLRVGPGRVLDSGVVVPPEVHAGDHVWFIEGFPAEMVVDGEKVLRMKERDLLAARPPTSAELQKLLVDGACRLAHDQLSELLDAPSILPETVEAIERGRRTFATLAHGDADDADLHGRAFDPTPSPTEGS